MDELKQGYHFLVFHFEAVLDVDDPMIVSPCFLHDPGLSRNEDHRLSFPESKIVFWSLICRLYLHRLSDGVRGAAVRCPRLWLHRLAPFGLLTMKA